MRMHIIPLAIVLAFNFVLSQTPDSTSISSKREAVMGKKFATLTIGDLQFTDVTVSKISDEGITLIYSGGVAKISWADAPVPVREAWGYEEEAYQKSQEAMKAQAEMRAAEAKAAQEAAEKRRILRAFESSYDKFEKTTSYRIPSRGPLTKSELKLYILVDEETMTPSIYLKPFYVGDDWIFMDKLQFSGIDHPGVGFSRESEVLNGGLVVEWSHILVENIDALINVYENADGYRFSGKYHEDFSISQEKRSEIGMIIKMYEMLGGK